MKQNCLRIMGVGLIFLSFNILVMGQKTVVPIVDLVNKGLLGGVQNGKWLKPETVAPKLKDETEFKLVGWKGVEEGGVTQGKKSETEGACPDFQRFKFELEMQGGVALGSNAGWNPMPRPLKEIGLTDKTYTDVVGDFLKTKGITKTTVKIAQAFRIDLDGDGREEVVLSATFYKKKDDDTSKRGDYSFVLVRKIVKGKAQNLLLAGDIITKITGDEPPSEYQISAIADLNGDGRMEIVVASSYYEGDSAEVYEMKANGFVRVLVNDCGA